MNTPSSNTIVNNHNHFSINIPNDYFSTKKFLLYHQNIRGIYNRIDELQTLLYHNTPQIICLTEHHLKAEEINNTNLDQYKMGASFCRKNFKYVGASIYVSKTLQFSTINLDKYHKEKDLKICALKLKILTNNFAIICVYRSPTGDLSYFLIQLKNIMNEIYNVF